MKLRGIKTYLRYSNRERKSFYYLILLLLVMVTYYFITHFRNSGSNHLIKPLVLENAPPAKDSLFSLTPGEASRLKKFNPNKVDFSTLIEWGIPKKAAHNWVKYLQKGGQIRDAQGIARIYGMSPEWVSLLTPYLEFEIKPKTTHSFQKANPILQKWKAENFDPNSAEMEQLIAAGLPPSISRVILNYRTRGGIFKKPEDMLKIYGMNDSLFALISPYLIFRPAKDNFQSIHEDKPAGPRSMVDINLSDTAGWKKLPGIGSVLAKRIIGFREILGGFTNIDQLLEVYGLKDSTLQVIRPLLLTSPVYRKIRINHDLPLTRAHPYLSVKDSKVISNFIVQNGPIKSPDDLDKILAFDKKYWERLLPYLSFEHEIAR